MGKALRRSTQDRPGRWRALIAALALALICHPERSEGSAVAVQDSASRIDSGRFTIVHYPSDAKLARSFLAWATENDSFPGLPRPTQRVLIAIAPDQRRFREWVGPSAPEWGAAVAFPESHRIVMQGQNAGGDVGDPREVLRHEIAHLALHEFMGPLPPRWFDEGYASFVAHEWRRDDVLAANVALALHGMPRLDELESDFMGGASRAQDAYALAYRAVAELYALDGDRGLSRFLKRWSETMSMEKGMRESYGITVGAFEDKWRANTRRRYGALALGSSLALAGAAISLVILPLYLARRRRDRARLAAMITADRIADEAAQRTLLEELLRPVSGSDKDTDGEAGSSPS